jgi:hypothetical protein
MNYWVFLRYNINKHSLNNIYHHNQMAINHTNMDTSYSTPFSKATLTGVFAGIVTTLLCLTYNILFRENTGFSLSELINVSSLIFLVNLIFLFLGIAYYFFAAYIRKGGFVYTLVFIGLTVYTSLQSMRVHRSDDLLLNTQFHHLLLGLVLIIGIAGSAGIPFLFHNKQFSDHVV